MESNFIPTCQLPGKYYLCSLFFSPFFLLYMLGADHSQGSDDHASDGGYYWDMCITYIFLLFFLLKWNFSSRGLVLWFPLSVGGFFGPFLITVFGTYLNAVAHWLTLFSFLVILNSCSPAPGTSLIHLQWTGRPKLPFNCVLSVLNQNVMYHSIHKAPG